MNTAKVSRWNTLFCRSLLNSSNDDDSSSSKRPKVICENSSLFTWPRNTTKSCKSRGFSFPVHLKDIRETTQAIKYMHIQRATKCLKAVTLQKQCVPFQCCNGEAGKCAQGRTVGLDTGSVTQIGCWILDAHASKCKE